MAMIRTYTETYDMNTEKDCPTVIGIHTPIGTLPYRFLEPAFKMYRKYKYLGADVTIVNAARLPVDPEQMGKIEGENYIDPRDTLNPLLFKGCHGESLGDILDSLYGGLLSTLKEESLDKEVLNVALRNFYYTALGDDSWRKSPIQKTLNLRGLHPLVYSVSTNHQLLPSNGIVSTDYWDNVPADADPETAVTNVPPLSPGYQDASKGLRAPIIGPTSVYDTSIPGYTLKQAKLQSFFTSKMHRLGWLDTLQFTGNASNPASPVGTDINQIAELPKLFMGILMLPPANLCRQYLRVIIRHKFKFAGFRTITTGGITADAVNLQYAFGYHNNITGNVPDGNSKFAAVDFDREPIEGDDPDE